MELWGPCGGQEGRRAFSSITCQTKYATLPGPRPPPAGTQAWGSCPRQPAPWSPAARPPASASLLQHLTVRADPARRGGQPLTVWACPQQEAVKRLTRGPALPLTTLFFSLTFTDRKPAPTHLPLARTSSSPAEEEKLVEILEELARRFK